MSENTIGTAYKVTTFGESHGKALGAVIDGCPAGVPLSEDILYSYLQDRMPGRSALATPRKEKDYPEILSGIMNGVTLGTPIAVIVKNTDALSKDYDALKDIYRPGHADFTYEKKYGLRDHRGGGRSSGRETLGRVIGGGIAREILKSLGVTISACVSSIGDIDTDQAFLKTIPLMEKSRENVLRMPDFQAFKTAESFLESCIHKGDSSGSTVFCRVTGYPAGLGRPVFSKLEARLSKAIMSIGGCKGISFGDEVDFSCASGSMANDPFTIKEGKIVPETNHAGGTLGGISSGADITFKAVFKPTPSIGMMQNTVHSTGEKTTLKITGRHDPVIGPRAVPVVEAMAAIILLDELFLGAFSRFDALIDFMS